MGMDFYIALAVAYKSHANFDEEYPEDCGKELLSKIMISLSLICLFGGV